MTTEYCVGHQTTVNAIKSPSSNNADDSYKYPGERFPSDRRTIFFPVPVRDSVRVVRRVGRDVLPCTTTQLWGRGHYRHQTGIAVGVDTLLLCFFFFRCAALRCVFGSADTLVLRCAVLRCAVLRLRCPVLPGMLCCVAFASVVLRCAMLCWVVFCGANTLLLCCAALCFCCAVLCCAVQVDYSQVDADRNPLASVARLLGIGSAFGVPLSLGSDECGVVMLYSMSCLPPR